MPAEVLAHWLKMLPEVKFANMYGSTETDMVICWPVPESGMQSGSIPLGYPCAGSEIFILKEDGAHAGDGEIGGICVSGPCLALGYYQDKEKTKAGFTQNPLSGCRGTIYHTGDLGEMRDGLIYFHGRRDHQFKHLGYRIEAGEIEACAEKFPGIKSACVLYDAEKRQIVLMYEEERKIDGLAFRRGLTQNLPVYMVPTRYIVLDRMPYNANGKKDRVLLKSSMKTSMQ
jgi:acyl-coenzyme A synthetase/AMP-(fatty) acid ligase